MKAPSLPLLAKIELATNTVASISWTEFGMYKIVREIREKPPTVGVLFHQIRERSPSVRCVEKPSSSRYLPVSQVPRRWEVPLAQVCMHVRPRLPPSAGLALRANVVGGVKNVDTRYVHDDDYPVLLLLGLLRIRSGRLYHLGIISTLAVPVL